MSSINAIGVCALGGLALSTLSICLVLRNKQKKIGDEFIYKFWVLSGRLQNWPRVSNFFQRNVETLIATDLKWTPRLLKIVKISALVTLVFGIVAITIHCYSDSDNSSGARKRK